MNPGPIFDFPRVAKIISAALLIISTSCNNDHEQQALPQVDTISPTSGFINTQVIITGSNFSTVLAENKVTFNGKEAVVVVATTTQLTATVPLTAGSGPVVVNVKGKAATKQPIFTVESPSPEVSKITPAFGPRTTIVIISGSNFSAVASENIVSFNGKVATISNATATQLTVTVPTAAGTGTVQIKTNGKLAANQPIFEYEWQVSTMAGNGKVGTDDGIGNGAKFYYPHGITADANNNIFVADRNNHRIRKITPEGVVSTFAGSSAGAENGMGTLSKFNSPEGLALDVQGNLFVADSYNYSIRKITPDKVVSTWAGGNGSGFINANGESAKFKFPYGVAIDSQGNIYIADASNNCIRKIAPNKEVSTFAGSEEAGFKNGTGKDARFNTPTGLAVDSHDNIYVADANNFCIRKITQSGEVSTFAGSGKQGFVNGIALNAEFKNPIGIAVDLNDCIYVADTYNHCIRKITPDQEVTTFAGSQMGEAGSDNGSGAQSKFNFPVAITLDARGIIYVADSENHLIRKIE